MLYKSKERVHVKVRIRVTRKARAGRLFDERKGIVDARPRSSCKNPHAHIIRGEVLEAN